MPSTQPPTMSPPKGAVTDLETTNMPLNTFPMPRQFRPAVNITSASRLPKAPPAIAKRRSQAKPRRGAKARGIRYERQAQAELTRRYGDNYLAGPWLKFFMRDEPRPRYCQPDGLIFTPNGIVIVEIKLAHCVLAWWQLEWLYLPVLRRLFPQARYSLCEFVRWYDPATSFPVPVTLVESPDAGADTDFSVHIWNPSR